MKSVMLSIKPKYCELIAAGKKTIEVRKTRPKIETPFKCYIYCTKEKYNGRFLHTSDKNGCLLFWLNENDCTIFRYPENTSYTAYVCNGKVIGEFVCDEIYQYTTCDAKDGVDISDGEMTRMSCLTKGEIKNYELSPGLFGVFGWHISDLVIYDEPKELNEFKKYNREWWYADLGLAKRDCPECQNEECFLTHPPQSWCYVED